MPPPTYARARRPGLLIVGCGDVGLRVLPHVVRAWRVTVLTSSPHRFGALRDAGARPLLGDLDHPPTLGRLAAVSDALLHLAPPPGHGAGDPRSWALARSLMRGGRIRRVVYVSTSGVYGDAQGALIDETRSPRPATERARRRVDAEACWRAYGRASGATVSVLRVPGIYADGRSGGHPRERLARGTPVLRAEDDVHTNHIHADDLARACVAALFRGAPQRVYHASDDTRLAMGDYFDLAARIEGVPPPPRVSRDDARQQLSPAAYSFMSESRQLVNRRLKRELKLRLRYPTVDEGLRATTRHTAAG